MITRREFLPLAIAPFVRAAATPRKTRHIVLFTSDGVRWQDLFTGIDAKLMGQKAAGMADAKALETSLWYPDPKRRREALMPFFWKTLVPEGTLLGNVALGSSMQVSNRYRVSYPGYSEILTGRAQDDVIRGNDPVRNPTPSFLQFLKEKQHLGAEQVAVFASWDNFHYSAESKAGDIYINAGYEKSRLPDNSAWANRMNDLQFDARYIEDSSRHDAFTFELGLEYLKKVQPEHLFLSFDETDDWAHDHRYDRVLESLQYLDRSLERLWNYLQNSSKYANSTTLVLTTDHGRGDTVASFSDHGPDVPGDEQIWAAFIGPDTPASGEVQNVPLTYQRDIAPTILDLLGFDYQGYNGVLGKPISAAIRGGSH